MPLGSLLDLQQQYANLSAAAMVAAKQFDEANDLTSSARNKSPGCDWNAESFHHFGRKFAEVGASAGTLALEVADQFVG